MRPVGPPGRVLALLAEGAFDLVLSEAIVDEFRRAARYPKVRTRIPLSDEELELWITALEVVAVFVEPRRVPRAVPADPDDDLYVAAALEGRAAYIVSGDTHLLDLGEIDDIAIITPRAFLETAR